MIREKILALLLFCTFLPLLLCADPALQVLPGSGVAGPEDSKQYHFKYHNLSDDFHLSGPLRWAVRFDFRGAYPAADSSSFNLQGIRLYSPISGMNLTLSIYSEQTVYTDSIHYFVMPGAELGTTSLVTSSPMQDVAFSGISSPLQVAWLIIDMPLYSNYLLTASEGSGEHSFFSNTNGPGEPYWQSMFSAGYACELRFGALGSFNFLNPKLEILSFSLGNSLTPSATVTPVCTVYNHHSSPINASLTLRTTDPNGAFDNTITLPLGSIPALDSLSTDPLATPSLTLPDFSTQLKAHLTLTYEATIRDSVFYGLFNNPKPTLIAEHFRRYSTATDGIPSPADSIHHLLYFPNQADNLSNLPAVSRLNYYGFNGLPKTVVDGSRRFQSPTSAVAIQQSINNAFAQKTYISDSYSRISGTGNPNVKQLEIKLYNQSTQMFPVSNINPKTFIGLFEPHLLGDQTYYVIKKWLAFNEAIQNPINRGDSLTISLTFNVADIDSLQNCRIYYWIQNPIDKGGQIFYANNATFPSGFSVPTSDDYLLPPIVKVYPNPVCGNNALKLSGTGLPTRYTIYNLKGQKVFSTMQTEAETSIPPSVFPSSGIYFLRSETPLGSKIHKQTQKISVIK